MKVGSNGGVGEGSPLVEAKGSQWAAIMKRLGKTSRTEENYVSSE